MGSEMCIRDRSDDDAWGVHWKFRKDKITEELWNFDVNRDGEISGDVTEEMLGADIDRNGVIGGQSSFWNNNGSSINN